MKGYATTQPTLNVHYLEIPLLARFGAISVARLSCTSFPRGRLRHLRSAFIAKSTTTDRPMSVNAALRSARIGALRRFDVQE